MIWSNNMKLNDPISIVKAFNDCINNQDIAGMASLMHEGHTFIDRDGSSHGPKIIWWKDGSSFLRCSRSIKTLSLRSKLQKTRVFVLGYAYWSEKEPYDPVIWTGKIENNLIAEWRVYEDSAENRKKFNF